MQQSQSNTRNSLNSQVNNQHLQKAFAPNILSLTNTLNRTNSSELENTTTTNNNNNKLFKKSSNKIIDEEDDLDTALNKLEKSLDIDESTRPVNPAPELPKNNYHHENGNGAESIPNKSENGTTKNCETQQLSEYLILLKQQRYTFKKLKTYYFILGDTHYLSYFKSREESNGRPLDKINLKSCELAPDVSLSSRRFGITIKIPSPEGMCELCIRCPNEQSYANWMSALKLASKMKPISDPAYSIEVKSILNLLQIQTKMTSTTKGGNTNSLTSGSNLKSLKTSLSASFQSISNASISDSAQVQATNLLPLRILKKYKLKQVNKNLLLVFFFILRIFCLGTYKLSKSIDLIKNHSRVHTKRIEEIFRNFNKFILSILRI